MATVPLLDERLRAVADRVVPRQLFADLGTDHAHLPIALVAEGRVPRALACDVATAPLAVARRNIAAAGLGAQVELRQGSGFEALGEARPATVAICGMGGHLVAQLLDRAVGCGFPLHTIDRLVLAPNNAWGQLRARLAALGMGLTEEVAVRAAGRIYLVLVAEPGRGAKIVDQADRELGPCLRRSPSAPYLEWARAELAQVERVLAEIPGEHAERRARFESRAGLLRALLGGGGSRPG